MSQELVIALRAVSDEVQRAQSIYGSFASAHEGYAVLLEEMDELKAEVWRSPSKRDYDAMTKEACQVAAMAVRLMIEIAEPQVVDEYRHIKKTITCIVCGSPYAHMTWRNGDRLEDLCEPCYLKRISVNAAQILHTKADQMPELPQPTIGALDVCKMCGESIWYVGPYWDHQGEMKPKHPATPVKHALADYSPTLF